MSRIIRPLWHFGFEADLGMGPTPHMSAHTYFSDAGLSTVYHIRVGRSRHIPDFSRAAYLTTVLRSVVLV